MKLNQYEWNPATDYLGGGAFGEVFKATDEGGGLVALKIYREPVLKNSTDGSYHSKYTLEKEFEKGKDLTNTNIIRYLGINYLQNVDHMGRAVSYPVLIMEYADAGTLEGRLKRAYPIIYESDLTTEILSENEITVTINAMLNGLGYLHDQGIIHRDLKPANILFKTDRIGRKVVKISDFGVSKDVLDESTGNTSVVGASNYMSPDQLYPKTFGINGMQSKAIDIWAFGVVFYRMLTGRLPFASMEDITNAEPDYNRIPQKYQPVIRGCLQKYAAKRLPDVEAILQMLKGSVEPPQPPPPLPPPPPPSPPPVKKTNKGIIAGAVFAGIIIVVLCFYLNPNRERMVTNKIFNAGLSNEYSYTGTIKDGLPNDTGSLVFKSGDKYKGGFLDGKANGYGVNLRKNGDSYKGYWKSDNKSGQGQYVFADGTTCNGNWENDKMNGYGTYVNTDGSKYEGGFKDGQQSGNGVITYKNGNIFRGDWKNDKLNGTDTCFFSDGNKYIGAMENGLYSGYGTFYWQNGEKYEGYWKNDYRDGHGKYTFADGSYNVGDWEADKKNGFFYIYDKDNKLLSTSTYNNGDKIGN